MIKGIIKFLILILIPGFLSAETGVPDWNPYVADAAISPSPLLPAEFNGLGEFSFIVGNSGVKTMKLVRNQEMSLMITLSGGVPSNEDPLLSIGGLWADKFDWSYDPQFNTYMGVQNEDIPASEEGTVLVRFRVTANSNNSSPFNGCNVNLQQPPYTNGVNLAHDDKVSAYTYVKAFDHGFAPKSYGEAIHEINVFKVPGTNHYENYVYLGKRVFPDFQGDSLPEPELYSFPDDNDGVVFPEMVRGDTVELIVTVTVNDFGHGVLYGWIDWNGDGDFTDSGEKVVGPLDFFESKSVTLTVEVPGDARIDRSVYARFRLGENLASPGGLHRRGEVEDYLITILAESERESNLTK